MAKRRLSMRKIKEVLRLKWGQKLSNRQIAKSCSISQSSVSQYLLRAKGVGLSWPLPDGLDDAAIERKGGREKGDVYDFIRFSRFASEGRGRRSEVRGRKNI